MSFDIYDEEMQEQPPRKKRSGCAVVIVIIAALALMLAAAAYFFAPALFGLAKTDTEKVTSQLIQGLRNHDEVILLDPITQEELNPVLEKVQRMPEFFYLSGEYQCLTKPLTGKVEITVIYSYDDIDAKQKQIDTEVDSLMRTIPSDASDFEKVLAVHDWLCDHIVYELSEDSSDQNIYGAIALGSCVCSGYAKSFSYILDRLEIENEYLTGTATDSNGESGTHAWNTAILDGNRYYFDITWDDAGEKGTEYFYFAITEDEMNLKHYTDDNTIKLCEEGRTEDGTIELSASATDDNYYYKNDYVLWTASPSELSSLIKAQGDGVARIRCRDASVYNYLAGIVKDSHGMYDVMTAAGVYVSSIYCVSNEDLMCMSIYY